MSVGQQARVGIASHRRARRRPRRTAVSSDDAIAHADRRGRGIRPFRHRDGRCGVGRARRTQPVAGKGVRGASRDRAERVRAIRRPADAACIAGSESGTAHRSRSFRPSGRYRRARPRSGLAHCAAGRLRTRGEEDRAEPSPYLRGTGKAECQFCSRTMGVDRAERTIVRRVPEFAISRLTKRCELASRTLAHDASRVHLHVAAAG